MESRFCSISKAFGLDSGVRMGGKSRMLWEARRLALRERSLPGLRSSGFCIIDQCKKSITISPQLPTGSINFESVGLDLSVFGINDNHGYPSIEYFILSTRKMSLFETTQC